MTLPLQNIRVLDVATWGVGPLAATVLGDWGADVIKIEDPVGGDPLRGVFADRAGRGSNHDGSWQHVNRGKRSVGIDLHTEAGQKLVQRLSRDADVFVTSFNPEQRQRYHIDVEQIRAENPDIIYARASAFGPRGDDADKGGHDINAFWSRAGVAHVAQLTGAHEYPPGPPVGAIGDYPTALILAGGIAAALFRRAQFGEPSVVDASLFGVGLWSVAYSLIGDTEWQRPDGGRSKAPNPLVNIYRTSDNRFIQLSLVRADRWWPDFCNTLERPDLISDPRFVDFAARRQNRVELIALLDTLFAAATFAEWCERLGKLAGPWAPVASPEEVQHDPQAIANDYFSYVDAGDGSQVRIVSVPVQLDETSPPLQRAPEHAEHTETVLLEAGLSWEELEALKDIGAIT